MSPVSPVLHTEVTVNITENILWHANGPVHQNIESVTCIYSNHTKTNHFGTQFLKL